MLLLLTGSRDGTSDLLAAEFGKSVFRFNFDIFYEYKIIFKPDYWEIESPTGHSINSNIVTSCFWWKAFSFFVDSKSFETDKYVLEEVKYIFRELYGYCKSRGLVKGNPYDFHNHVGKINILSVAMKSFEIPKTLVSIGIDNLSNLIDGRVVAKSLASGMTTSNKVLFTTEVSPSELDGSYPWFLQELLVSDSDITVFVCGEKLFAFSRDREGLVGLDWRTTINTEAPKVPWVFFDLDSSDDSAIRSFCKSLKVDWGRIDFMKTEKGLLFLEFNANGQWVFLDYDRKHGLVDEVVKYLQS